MRSGATPSPASSSADGSETVTYWLRECTRGDSHDSIHHPIRATSQPATGHCSRWMWWTSTTTGAVVARREKNGTPFWVSTTTSGRRSAPRGPSPNRPNSIASRARG